MVSGLLPPPQSFLVCSSPRSQNDPFKGLVTSFPALSLPKAAHFLQRRGHSSDCAGPARIPPCSHLPFPTSPSSSWVLDLAASAVSYTPGSHVSEALSAVPPAQDTSADTLTLNAYFPPVFAQIRALLLWLSLTVPPCPPRVLFRRLTQEKIDNLNRPITSEESQLVTKKLQLSHQKSPAPNGFNVELKPARGLVCE